jgi:hypothetical protein
VTVLRNSLASIASLPSETLIRIFWLCIESEREAGLKSLDVFSFRCYTWIGHICHAWRTIALDTPLLWTHPLFLCPEMAEAMTTRAMDLPLTIKCGLDVISLSSVIPILQARPIRSLSLVGVARRLRVGCLRQPCVGSNLSGRFLARGYTTANTRRNPGH